ncbi:putative ATP-dependent RNA helicase SoYb isoform X2 [Drosophila subpulchrella]|uniref:putative ATP-dependent RNA helicase SoYb isoform X2 n=1 Tax=Drosophila subpulchrella TaxID=1486046 RepID=UPI0018A19B78|nr:putative ATP-dependent RNA helicase SoYb isoform X2 [Drosophila subpulchrella]
MEPQLDAGQGEPILITHFVNPHKFSYVKCKDVQKSALLVLQIEQDLKDYCSSEKSKTVYLEDERVIVRYMPWKPPKLLRGVVLKRQYEEYLVRIVDYGFTLCCSVRDLWPLPEHLSRSFWDIKEGGVAFIIPSFGSCWPRSAIRSLDKQLEEATQLTFKVLYKSSSNRDFGQLLLRSSSQTEDAAEFLIQREHARRNESQTMLMGSSSDELSFELAEINDLAIDARPRVRSIMELVAGSSSSENPQKLHLQKLIYTNVSGALNAGANRYTLTHPSTQPQKLDALLQNRNTYLIPETGKILSKIQSNSGNSVQTALVNWSKQVDTKIPHKKNKLEVHGKLDEKFVRSENLSDCISKLKLSAVNQKYDQKDNRCDSNPTKPSLSSENFTAHLDQTSSLKSSCSDKAEISESSTIYSSIASNGNETDQLNTRTVTFSMEKLDQIFNDMLGKTSSGSLIPRSGSHQSNPRTLTSTSDLAKKAESDVDIPIYKSKGSPTHLVLAHSAETVDPVRSYNELHLCKEIQLAMNDLKFHSPLPTQMYSWPHLVQGGSLVLVNGSGTGRSWSYLPVVCSSVLRSLQNAPTSLEDRLAPGPLALLVVDSVENAKKLTSHCDFLMRDYNTEFPNVVNTHAYSMDDVYLILLNSCGVLVTTMTHLLDILVSTLNLVDLTRLQFLIFDDFDRMRLGNPQLLDEVLQKVHSFGCLTMQLVLVAQQWHSEKYRKLLKRSIKPLILFGDFFEAALYGGLKMKIILRNSALKTKQLLEILAAQEGPRKRTLIYCKDQMELDHLKIVLTGAGHQCVGISRALNLEPHELMLVKDSQLQEQLPMRNIELLIHFSLSESWLRFASRFHTMAGNIRNLLTTSPGNEKHSLVTYLMLDERNSREWSRTIKFLQDHGIETKELMPHSWLKLDDSLPYCPYLLSSGDCNRNQCNKRHYYVSTDLPGPGNPLQQAGTLIRCKLYQVYDAVHMAVWPMKYKTKDSTTWIKVPYPSNPSTLVLKMSLGVPKKVHSPCNLNDVCFVLYQETWRRVRIVDIPPKQLVSVQFLDHGREIVQVKPSELKQCPEKYRTLPPLAMDIRLSELVPAGEEGKWSANTIQWVQENLHVVDGQVIQICVDCAVLDVVYVKEVALIEECPTMLTSVYKIFLSKELLRQGFAKTDKSSIQELRVMHEHQKQEMEKLEADKENFSFVRRNTDLEDHKFILTSPRKECTELTKSSEESDLSNKKSFMIASHERFINTEKSEEKGSKELYKESTCKVDTEDTDEKSIQEKQAQIDPSIDSTTALLNTLIHELNTATPSKKKDTQHFIHNLVNGEENQDIPKRKSCAKPIKLNKTLEEFQLEPSKEQVTQSLNCATKSEEVVHPRVKWHQTQTHIELIIEQRVPEYKLIVEGNTIVYKVTTPTPNQRCLLNLLGEVKIDREKQHGYYLHVKLTKQHSHWLIYDTERAQGAPPSVGLILLERYLNHEKRNNHSDSEEDESNSPDVFIESGVEYGNVDDSVYEDF